MVDNPRKGKVVHSIVLPRLRGFHASMRSSGLTAAAFSYKNNKAELQILFITSEAPYVLVIAPQGVRPLSIVVDVQPGYKVVPFLGADYGPLLEMLGVERSPDNPFRVVDFFKDLDAHIPDSSTTPRSPKPHEMAARGHDFEEPDKIYFLGWRHNTDGRNVTPGNLAKTSTLMSPDTADRCRRSNTSSRWTADYSSRVPVTPPPEWQHSPQR